MDKDMSQQQRSMKCLLAAASDNCPKDLPPEDRRRWMARYVTERTLTSGNTAITKATTKLAMSLIDPHRDYGADLRNWPENVVSLDAFRRRRA